MNRKFQTLLFRKFPLLYNKDAASRRFAGFEVADGWFELIHNLSSKLEALILKLQQENPDEPLPCVVQVKEKFGTLRFYLSSSTDEMESLINEAEELSSRTCDQCGLPGVQTSSGWIRVRCNRH